MISTGKCSRLKTRPSFRSSFFDQFALIKIIISTLLRQNLEACYRLDLVELRIIMMAIHIGRMNDRLAGGEDRNLCDPIRIDARLFTEHFPMAENAVYEQIKHGVKSLMRKPLSTIEPINGKPCPVDIPWFSRAAYVKNESHCKLNLIITSCLTSHD